MSPEVQFLGERMFKQVSNNMSATTDELYNAGLTLGCASTSSGKENVPPKRVLNRSNYLRSPFETLTQRCIIQPNEQRLYDTIVTICDDEDFK
jgi:hypothetical protein